MNDSMSAPIAIIASVAMSDIYRNKSVTVTFSTDPFGVIFPRKIIVSGIHPTLSFDLHYDVDPHQDDDQHHCQLVQMTRGTSFHRLSQWKSRLRSAYILSIDTMSVHTLADVRLVISEARSAKRKSAIFAFTKDDAPNCLSGVGLPQM
jgi:hypothetical protein